MVGCFAYHHFGLVSEPINAAETPESMISDPKSRTDFVGAVWAPIKKIYMYVLCFWGVQHPIKSSSPGPGIDPLGPRNEVPEIPGSAKIQQK